MSELNIPFYKLDSQTLQAVEFLKANGAAIGVKQNSDAVLTTVLKKARGFETAFQASCVKRQKLLTPAVNQADADARKYINDSKKILKMDLGERWSHVWADVGFVNGSINTPSLVEEREGLLVAMGAFFQANPEREVGALQVTAARAQEIHAALSAARAARNAHDLAHRELREHRKEATETLRKRLHGLRSELNVLLPKNDVRRAAFGLAPRTTRKRTDSTVNASSTSSPELAVVPEVKAAA